MIVSVKLWLKDWGQLVPSHGERCVPVSDLQPWSVTTWQRILRSGEKVHSLEVYTACTLYNSYNSVTKYCYSSSFSIFTTSNWWVFAWLLISWLIIIILSTESHILTIPAGTLNDSSVNQTNQEVAMIVNQTNQEVAMSTRGDISPREGDFSTRVPILI